MLPTTCKLLLFFPRQDTLYIKKRKKTISNKRFSTAINATKMKRKKITLELSLIHVKCPLLRDQGISVLVGSVNKPSSICSGDAFISDYWPHGPQQPLRKKPAFTQKHNVKLQDTTTGCLVPSVLSFWSEITSKVLSIFRGADYMVK